MNHGPKWKATFNQNSASVDTDSSQDVSLPVTRASSG
jgi:hypothetical protein